VETQTLSEALAAAGEALHGEAARRRWGRAIDYFLSQLESTSEQPVTAVARDVVQDLLRGSNGLLKNAASVSAGLEQAVAQLERTCWQTIATGVAAPFAFGLVHDQRSPIGDELAEVFRRIRSLQASSTADFTLITVFIVPGRLTTADFAGVRSGRLSAEFRLLQNQAAVPADVKSMGLLPYVYESLDKSIDLANGLIRRRKLSWSVGSQNTVLDLLRGD
jgi:hypothetical protein